MPSYEIIIKQEVAESDSDSNLAGGNGKKDKDNSAKSTSAVKKALKYATIQSARQLVVSKVGEYTRNNLLQQKVDIAIGLAQTAVAFAVDPVYGAINLGISLISQSIDYSIKVSKETNRLGVMAERAGYINRSRND